MTNILLKVVLNPNQTIKLSTKKSFIGFSFIVIIMILGAIELLFQHNVGLGTCRIQILILGVYGYLQNTVIKYQSYKLLHEKNRKSNTYVIKPLAVFPFSTFLPKKLSIKTF